ncbi:branched-chain amino acid ABC transporter substrate-binding protein [Paraburkholderia rhynchosiae]|uniref:Branched chain amino acid ABC transporter substrate-binding protein n=1 Tax=Paraburkholderia rhynchosiae TaxID=487049 RepID=A0A2N7W9E8_9BURK|nr:branched-chain amino acid ABC transporter substrate-binding protein [Paraburkholderia rhynchosiae]PMS26036.1 branched chain amino acid ABC transporter substrate-binding protein [Paraburkholderia rhynchosiae]CAB3731461.1 Leucine-, isoleucine-, valine-, threonine-, and alanine-binding protein [Paraburkholderia rhynchosiae]
MCVLKKIRISAVVAATGLLLSGVASADDVTRIGVAVPLTGNNAAYGKDIENAVKLAVSEANASNLTIGGKPLKLVVESGDDQADPRTGVQIAQQLVDKGVTVVIGHFNSGTTIPASKIYSNAHVPMITPAATNPTITEQGSAYVFSIIATDAQNAGAAGRYAVEVAKAKRIAVIDDRTAFGQGEADEFVKAVTAAQGGIVDRQYTNDKAVDFSAQLTHIKGQNADLVFFAGLNPQAGMVKKKMKQLGIRAQFVGGGGVVEPTFLGVAGADAEGAMAWEYGSPIASLPRGKEFEAKYQQKFGSAMLSYAPFAYDATWSAIKAMQAANSTKPADFLAKLRAQEYAGITGDIQFTASGALTRPSTTLYQVANGKWVPVKTVR